MPDIPTTTHRLLRPVKKSPDYVRLLGLALVAAAIALYVRDCGRRQSEQTALLAVRAAASDPGATVAFLTDDPQNPGAKLFRPVRDAAAASNVVAALADAQPGGAPAETAETVEHDVMLLGSDRRSAFFRLRRAAGSDRVAVSLLPAPPPAGPAPAPAMSAAGLADVLARIEAGELLDENAAIRIVDPQKLVAYTNVWPAAADTDPAAALRAMAARPLRLAERAPAKDGAPIAPFGALSRPALERLAAALAAAEPTEFPAGTHEGDLWQLRVFADAGELFVLQAAVLEARPDDAFVGFLALPAPGATNAAARLSAPALVPGLGAALRAP